MTSHFSNSTAPVYIRQKQLIPGIVPISAATLWRWVAAGKFPAPIKLGERVTAWLSVDVQRWLDAQNGANQI
ncbi:helix-turn-helix transcriptional regulator [Collimonas fungivorans]|uniref:helix-turn-helix transcriptional regulator n=1 Tax=Collimonas fungivorans TaxID=158899 RepID=UPI003FA3AD8F